MVGDKIISFSEGSKYYYEMGNYYYQKNNLDKALTYYQRALAVDPANPVNHFNVACLLSELGKYRESSSMFKHIVTELDTNLSESWFWLAMNHGQLQQYKEACQYLRKYLEQEPDGDYSWQAQEILEYMRSDLPMLSQKQRNKIDRLCAKGIDLVNQGSLKEAIKCFTAASNIEPEMIAPRNNLALSWFYLGEIHKAVEMTQEILSREPDNVFANCNLATFYYVVENQLALRRQVHVLDGLWSDEPDEMIKLSTTYGLLGMDKRSLAVLNSLYESGFRSYELILLMGIANYNCGQIANSAQLFEKLNEMEPDNPYQVYRQLCDIPFKNKIPYHLRIPNESIALVLETDPQQADITFLKECPKLWPQVLWIIRSGNGVARERLIAGIIRLNFQPLLEQLIEMIWQPKTEGQCRQEIFAALAHTDIPVWHQRFWNQGKVSNSVNVLETALGLMFQEGHGLNNLYLAFNVWTSFAQRKRPRIRKVGLWCAALLVFVQGLDKLEELSATFEVSPQSVYKAVRQLTSLV